MKLSPFCALRPPKSSEQNVASPPYDVIDTEEARAFAGENAACFLHVTRPEVGLSSDIDIHADEVYAEARHQLERLCAEGHLIQDDTPALWAYRQIMDGRTQTGIVGCSNVSDYDTGAIKKHEFTRPDKEDDRTRHVDTTDANAGPVFLACRNTSDLAHMISDWTTGEPEFDFVGWDGVHHTLWRIDDTEQLQRARQVYEAIPAFYIADGHHRAASARRVRDLRRGQNPSDDGQAHWNRFLTVVFPDEQLEIMAYNRVVADLNGLSEAEFFARISENFEVSAPGADATPAKRHEFSMYLGNQWYQVTARDHVVNEDDAVACLDVAILQDHLLAPVLNIDNPRTNSRIRFVGGIRGTEELERLVGDKGQGVAFSMFPTSMAELFAVADDDNVMPPKSTWFEPKLASGLLVHKLS